MEIALAVLALAAPLAGLGYHVWKKRWSAEAELARRVSEAKARRDAERLAAQRLRDDYERIDKEQRTDEEILDRLNNRS